MFVRFASEVKSLQDICDHYECFPPGHYYVGRYSLLTRLLIHYISLRIQMHLTVLRRSTHAQKGEMKQFYNEKWFVDKVQKKIFHL